LHLMLPSGSALASRELTASERVKLMSSPADRDLQLRRLDPPALQPVRPPEAKLWRVVKAASSGVQLRPA
jgi:hypothetical protein